MPYTREQLRAYWAANKVILNQRRKEKRRLAKLGLATLGVSHNSPGEVSQIEQKQVSHLEVSQKQEKVSHHQPETANLKPVSHGKPENSQLNSAMVNPVLIRLIKEWQTSTNYSCPPTCFYSYCSNCWYFRKNELIDYKEISM